MTPDELRTFLADERENGFLSLGQIERTFALEFVASGSYIEAAEKAGIGRDRARRLLKDSHVACFINYLNQRKEHFSLIDVSFVEVQYLSLFAKLMGDDEIDLVDKEGTVSRVKKFHASEAVAALRDMAKISGHLKDDPSLVVINGVQLTEEQQAILNKALDERY